MGSSRLRSFTLHYAKLGSATWQNVRNTSLIYYVRLRNMV